MQKQVTLSQNYLQRFGGITRLYGQPALEKLAVAHFTVVGLGGVGSWVAEALARSGVGKLTLIELDDICITNTNRQLHALTSTLGQQKNATLSARLKDINPELMVHACEDFLTRNNLETLINASQDVVIDAIDSANVKAALAAHCIYHKQRLVMAGSSGGKADPSQIKVNDLGRTIADPLLGKVRNLLHRHYNFERNNKRKFRVDAVYSTEQMRYPQPDGSVCQNKKNREGGLKLDCAAGFGSSSLVTGSFGLMAANKAIERYLQTAS